jgi:hypothetical protein
MGWSLLGFFVPQTNQTVLYGDTIAIIAVCSEFYMKEINTVCGENAKSFNFKSAGTYSYNRALSG